MNRGEWFTGKSISMRRSRGGQKGNDALTIKGISKKSQHQGGNKQGYRKSWLRKIGLGEGVEEKKRKNLGQKDIGRLPHKNRQREGT